MGAGMQQTVKKVFFALIRFEINGDELCGEMKNLITPEVLPALFKLSKRHDLAHLIADALDKNCLLLDGTEAKKRFLQERNMSVYRYEQIQYEFEQICDALEKAKIPFIPLKGSVIRQYYPDPWMRTSCDIDILVKESMLEETAQFLCAQLGYESEEQKTVNELSLFSPSGVHLELHYDLTEGDKYGKDILSHILDYTTLKEEGASWYLLSDSAFYFYHIAHMVKHFEHGGCGVRPFLDLWLLKNKVSYNQVEKDELLQQGGFLKFAKASEELSTIWFGKQDMSELGERLQSYILTGGVYGTLQNSVGMQQSKKGVKIKYILSRIFISNKELKIKYPQVEKHPWLAPFYHIKRWIKPLTQKQSRNASLTELSETSSVEEMTRKENIRLLQDLGL